MFWPYIVLSLIAVNGIFLFFFSLWALLHCLLGRHLSTRAKVVWFLVMLFVPFSVFVYGIVVSGSRFARGYSIFNFVLIGLFIVGGIAATVTGFHKKIGTSLMAKVMEMSQENLEDFEFPESDETIEDGEVPARLPMSPEESKDLGAGVEEEVPVVPPVTQAPAKNFFEAIGEETAMLRLEKDSSWEESEQKVATEMLDYYSFLMSDGVLNQAEYEDWLAYYRNRKKLTPGFLKERKRFWKDREKNAPPGSVNDPV